MGDITRINKHIEGRDDLVQRIGCAAQCIVQIDGVEAVVHIVADSLFDHLVGKIHSDQESIQPTQAHTQQPGAAAQIKNIQFLVGVTGNDLLGNLLG